MVFNEHPPETDAPLTFVPPMIENPAEVSQSDLQHTHIPAIISRQFGKGKITYLPWDLGALYNRLALPAHAQLLTDIIDKLLPSGRQITTSAHSSVEMVMCRKEGMPAQLLHLINLSGQANNAYKEAIPMRDIAISVKGKFTAAASRKGNLKLPIEHKDDYSSFVLPVLNDYDVIVIGE